MGWTTSASAAELLLEPVQGRGVVEPQDRLQRDALPALAVEGLVDDPHPAGAEAAPDLEALRAGELAEREEVHGRIKANGPGSQSA